VDQLAPLFAGLHAVAFPLGRERCKQPVSPWAALLAIPLVGAIQEPFKIEGGAISGTPGSGWGVREYLGIPIAAPPAICGGRPTTGKAPVRIYLFSHVPPHPEGNGNNLRAPVGAVHFSGSSTSSTTSE
jgi:hypothetical protein